MYEKIKSMPRLTAAAICVVMLFFPFVSSEISVSGLDCIQTNGLSILLILIPVFIILVDLNVVRLKDNLDNKLILACSVINIGILVYSWYYSAKANEELENLANMFGQESMVKIRPGIGLIISLIADIVIIIITLKKHFDIDVVDKVKQNIPENINLPNVDLSKMSLQGEDFASSKKKVCYTCKKTYSPNIKFCPECGGELNEYVEPHCSQCGKNVKQGVKFCENCGGKIKGGLNGDEVSKNEG